MHKHSLSERNHNSSENQKPHQRCGCPAGTSQLEWDHPSNQRFAMHICPKHLDSCWQLLILKQETTPSVDALQAGPTSLPDSVGYILRAGLVWNMFVFPDMSGTPKRRKMPNYINTWICQTAACKKKKIPNRNSRDRKQTLFALNVHKATAIVSALLESVTFST